jgi:LacI family transcriptional regulator
MRAREVDDAPGDACVVDNAAGAELVAHDLLTLGHRAIAAVFGPQSTSTGRDREHAFRAVLAAAGVELAPERWLRIPDDITLIGFDDVLLARWQAFRLTTVSQDVGQMVQVCTELLLSRIAAGPDAPPEPRRVVLPARLVRRATHGPPPPA